MTLTLKAVSEMPIHEAVAEIGNLMRDLGATSEQMLIAGALVGRLAQVRNHGGYDAEHWYESYAMVRDAIGEHLADFVHEDDVAEEGIFVAAVEQAGAKLKAVSPRRRGRVAHQ